MCKHFIPAPPMGGAIRMPELGYLPVDKLYVDPILNRDVNNGYVVDASKWLNSGFMGAIVVAEQQPGKFLIVEGQHRWSAAKAAKVTSVPCVVCPWLAGKTAEEIMAEIVQLNNSSHKWETRDFVKVYKNLGKPGYDILHDAMVKMNGNPYNDNYLASFYLGTEFNVSSQIRIGKITVIDQKFSEKMVQKFTALQSHRHYTKEQLKDPSFSMVTTGFLRKLANYLLRRVPAEDREDMLDFFLKFISHGMTYNTDWSLTSKKDNFGKWLASAKKFA